MQRPCGFHQEVERERECPGDRGRRGRRWVLALGCAVGLLPAVAALALLADDFDEEPIRYSASKPADPVSQLQQKLDRKQVVLRKEGPRGYLRSVLRALNIPASSQTLVFSKTSFQRDRISPLTPRALYFNDDTYIGWVQGGSVLEVSTTDPQLGAVFYTLDQSVPGTPKFVRQTYECLSCHASTLTRGVPGHTVRSVYSGRDGLPLLQAGTFVTTDESPMEERWGGWYVTGKHGGMRHMGNLTVKDAQQAEELDRDPGANVTDLRGYFDTTPYLTPHSDIVALTVMQHQTAVHNLITRAGYETRKALHFEAALNRELGRPGDRHSDSTLSRIKSGCEPLVRGLLFSGEAKLQGPVSGTSGFAAEFTRQGPRDSKGRSLRELDLKQRLLRYPCSHLVYSEAFDALPAEAKEYVYRRLDQVLSGTDTSKEFAHLSPADRQAVREILLETKPGFAAWCRQESPAG